MLNELKSLKQPGMTVENVVYLGAGVCPDFHKLKELQPARIVLVEANRQNVAELKSAYGSEENLIVLENLVVAEGEEADAELLVTNLPGYSSILEPSRLSVYYPNIRVVRRDKVPAITLAKLCDHLAIEVEAAAKGLDFARSAKNVLLVDLPGYEARFVASLPPVVLRSFDLILCRAATEAVYGGAQPLAELESIFRGRHFKTEVIRELTYPFVMLSASLDELAILRSELSEAQDARQAEVFEREQLQTSLRSELGVVKDRNEQFEQQIEELRVKLKEAQDARQAAALECEHLQTSLGSELGVAKDRNEQFEQQIEELRAELRGGQDAQQTAALECEYLQASLGSELGVAKDRNEQFEQQIEELGVKLKEAQDARQAAALECEHLQTSLGSELGVAKDRNEQFEQQIEELRAELKEAQDTKQILAFEHEKLQKNFADLRVEKGELSKSNQLISKTLLKAQTDLDDLRERYRDLKEAKARQNGVMMQVSQRLQRASDQYVKLVDQYPELRELGEIVLLPVLDGATEGETE